MRIAMIQPSLIAPTGGERLVLRLAIELQKFGHEVEVFVNSVDRKRCFPEMLEKVPISKIRTFLNFCRVIKYNEKIRDVSSF